MRIVEPLGHDVGVLAVVVDDSAACAPPTIWPRTNSMSMPFTEANSSRCALASSARSNRALARSRPSSASSSSAQARWPVPSCPPLRPDAPSPKRCASISVTDTPALRQMRRRRQSGEAAADDGDVAIPVAVQRRIGRALADGRLVPGIARGNGGLIGHDDRRGEWKSGGLQQADGDRYAACHPTANACPQFTHSAADTPAPRG